MDGRRELMRRLRGLKDESGSAVILTAVFMGIVFLGVAALAVDVGWIYHQKRIVQAAADDAALAAAVAESESGASKYDAASAAATANGLTVVTGTPSAGQATVAITNDGIPGPTGSNKEYVQVTVTNVTPTFFLRAFKRSFATLPVTATAQASYTVAPSGGGGPCFLQAGSPSAAPVTLNGGTITGSNCNFVVDNTTASPVVSGCGANVNLKNFELVKSGSGSILNQSNCNWNSTSVQTGATSVPDPFKAAISAGTLTQPTQSSVAATYGNQTTSTLQSTTTLNPGVYGSLNFNSGSGPYTVTLNPGVYYFTQGLNIDTNVTVTGTGVTLYIGNGQLNVNSSATIDITAPSTGPTQGIAVWQAPSDSNEVNLDAGSQAKWQGAVYVPSAQVTWNSGSGTASYSMVVAQSFMFNSGANVSLGCSSMPGGVCPGGSGDGTTSPVAGGVGLAQ